MAAVALAPGLAEVAVGVTTTTWEDVGESRKTKKEAKDATGVVEEEQQQQQREVEGEELAEEEEEEMSHPADLGSRAKRAVLCPRGRTRISKIRLSGRVDFEGFGRDGANLGREVTAPGEVRAFDVVDCFC